MLTLQAKRRDVTKRARTRARWEGLIPAVLYGRDIEPVTIAVDGSAFRSVSRNGARHKPIRLEVSDMEEPQVVLIKDIQYDLLNRDVIHVDFLRPVEGKRMHVRVPLVVRGDDVLTGRGLILEHQLHDVDCECMPDNVPEAIYVDIQDLEPGQNITLGDLKAPEGVKISGHPDSVVVTVEAPRVTVVPGEGEAQVTAGD